MPRPPAELRQLEDEQRRRARAHRRLVWGRRLQRGLWIAGSLAVLGVLVLLARLVGVSLG